MKRPTFCIMLIILFCLPAYAKDSYHIEVLQVSKINPYDWAYEGFVEELARSGIVKGKNLVIHREIIDADADAGIWKKVGILLKIKSSASEIVEKKPDLVLTISTPATKYAKDKFISAGIPVVFTAVAIPKAVGCASLTKAGPGFTGSTLYLDPLNALKITKLAFPELTTMAFVHSDDDNAIAFVEEARAKAKSVGINIITKQVGKSDSVIPAAKALIDQGAQAFGIPIDTYYAIRNYEVPTDLYKLIEPKKIPSVCYCHVGFSGAILYVGSEFKVIGALSGKQAVKILKEGAKPETLPIMMQDDLKILVDLKNAKNFGIDLPLGILQIAKTVETERK